MSAQKDEITRFRYKNKGEFINFCNKFKIKISKNTEEELSKVNDKNELLFADISHQTMDDVEKCLKKIRTSCNWKDQKNELLKFLIIKTSTIKVRYML